MFCQSKSEGAYVPYPLILEFSFGIYIKILWLWSWHPVNKSASCNMIDYTCKLEIMHYAVPFTIWRISIVLQQLSLLVMKNLHL